MEKTINQADLFIFMGQSNMAGRGDLPETISCIPEAGFEFRAISDPSRLYPVEEPFGYRENNPEGIDDGTKKSGGLVPSFINTYFQLSGRPVIAVSASEGGTTCAQWVSRLAADAAARLKAAKEFLAARGSFAGHIYMVWSQGESDGDAGTAAEVYREKFLAIYNKMKEQGVEKCFLIQTGHFNYPAYPEGINGLDGRELDRRYGEIRKAQERLCGERKEIVMAATFADYISCMRDPFHYYQRAYNETGACAAESCFRTEREA